jgi:hypothetical protein
MEYLQQRHRNHLLSIFHLLAPPYYYHPSSLFSRQPFSHVLSTSTSSAEGRRIIGTNITNSSNSTSIASTGTGTSTTASSMLSSIITTIITPNADRDAIIQKNKKIIFGVRHGTSIANGFMSQPGHRLGDVTFYDDVRYTDAPLSLAGHQQVGQLAASFGDTVQSLWSEQS